MHQDFGAPAAPAQIHLRQISPGLWRWWPDILRSQSNLAMDMLSFSLVATVSSNWWTCCNVWCLWSSLVLHLILYHFHCIALHCISLMDMLHCPVFSCVTADLHHSHCIALHWAMDCIDFNELQCTVPVWRPLVGWSTSSHGLITLLFSGVTLSADARIAILKQLLTLDRSAVQCTSS